MKTYIQPLLLLLLLLLPASAGAELRENLMNPGQLPPNDSELKVAVGDEAPDFELRSIDGKTVRLSDYRRKHNVVLSFVPAAWTPVCSGQWPGYNLIKDEFEKHDAVILGISVDNLPTLHAWTNEMHKLWFPVLSDFWPHGKTAERYGILRSDGTAERALFVIDKDGIIRFIDVHDINKRPPLEELIKALAEVDK